MKLDSIHDVDTKNKGFCVRTDGPARFDVFLVDGALIMHAYEGVEDDEDQEPSFAFDGTLPKGTNREVTIPDLEDKRGG